MKKILMTTMTMFTVSIFASQANERSDINQVLSEITYIKEVVQRLKKNNVNNKTKVRFNYDAMLQQLTVMQRGIQEYLNMNIKTIHTTPPKSLNNPLYNVRKN